MRMIWEEGPEGERDSYQAFIPSIILHNIKIKVGSEKGKTYACVDTNLAYFTNLATYKPVAPRLPFNCSRLQ